MFTSVYISLCQYILVCLFACTVYIPKLTQNSIWSLASICPYHDTGCGPVAHPCGQHGRILPVRYEKMQYEQI